MLEVRILKTHYASVHEARRILPYIEQCDIFSMDSNVYTKESASKFELDWRESLKNQSRSKLLKKIEGSLPNMHADSKLFIVKLFDYTFRNNKPFYFAERFDPEQATEVNKLITESNSKLNEALDFIDAGKIEESLGPLFAHYQLKARELDLRDRNIAENLEIAEKAIRESNPTLEKKDTIKLLVQTGTQRYPENYFPDTNEVITLLRRIKTDTEKINIDILEIIRRGMDEKSMLNKLREFANISQ